MPKNACAPASTSARIRANCPSSGIIRSPPAADVRRRRIVLERLGHFRRHVFLIVLGEDFIGDERAVLHAAVRHHALPVAEQVRQDARIFHRHRVLEIRDQELDVERARRSSATLPFSTMPPRRKRSSGGASPAAISVGS